MKSPVVFKDTVGKRARWSKNLLREKGWQFLTFFNFTVTDIFLTIGKDRLYWQWRAEKDTKIPLYEGLWMDFVGDQNSMCCLDCHGKVHKEKYFIWLNPETLSKIHR